MSATENAVWIREARASLKNAETDFFKVNAARYWLDFLISTTLAYTAASIFLISPLFSLPQLIAFPFAVFWLYRSGSLIHEVCHLGSHLPSNGRTSFCETATSFL